MRRTTRSLAILIVAAGASAEAYGQGRTPSGVLLGEETDKPTIISISSPGPFVAGRWSGYADLGEGPEDIVIRVVEFDGSAQGEVEQGDAARDALALVDLPSRSVFGYPAEEFARDAEGLSFTIAAAGPSGGEFVLRGEPTRRSEGESYAIEGTAFYTPAAGGGGEADLEPTRGPFLLSLTPDPDRGEPYSIEIEGGALAGSLVMPEAARGWNVPVALILAGSGEADRDGNNYNVPGRSDCLALLARELRSRGVASLRYDKRDSGESLASAPTDPSFDDYVDDAEHALRELASDPRFSEIVVVGHAEGALVGAAALAREGGGFKGRVRGLAALCASGMTEGEILRRELRLSIEDGFAELSDDERAALASEAESIVASLEAGESFPDPSAELAVFFDLSAQAYYASALRYDIRAEAASIGLPLLVVAGGADLQVPAEEAEVLLEARPDAAYRVIEGMSHSLKAVGDDEDTNYASFLDPSFPLGEGLVDLIAAFARGDSLP